MSKVKGAVPTTWSHHESMIVNLKDWVNREINSIRNDIAKEAPDLSSSTSKLLKSAEDMNVQLFDLIRSVAEQAEAAAKKSKKTTKAKDDEEAFDG